MDESISELEYQLLNWARKIAVMEKQQLSSHFKKLSKTARKQLGSIPVINSQPKTAIFPFVLASQHQQEQLSPVSTSHTESPSRMDTLPPILSTPTPNTTTRNRREAFNDSENEDEEYQPRSRPRRVTDRVAPAAPVVVYAEHQKIKELLTIYAPIKRWQRYAETTSYQRQPLYETAQMISLSNLQEIEEDELITKFYIDIKNSLNLALECESKAAYHHFNVGQKLAILHDRLHNDLPRLKNILNEGLSMSLRRMRDIIPQIHKWFLSAECQSLPGTHILSRGFWRSEPNEFHNFDTVKAINDHEGDILPKDFFNELVLSVFDKCKNPKKIMNCLIGCLNKKDRTVESEQYTSDLNDAIRIFFEDPNSIFFPIENYELPTLYRISKSKTTERYENLVPIYWQVVANANIQASRLARKMGGKLVRIKTDSILVEDANDIELEPSPIGGYKVEPLKGVLKKSDPFENNYQYTLKLKDWNKEQSNDGGKLITGWAGSGKSHEVKQLVKEIGSSNCALLATTNRASRLITDKKLGLNFITCHTFLGVFEGQTDFSKPQLLKLAKQYKYIFIDEIGLMSRKLYDMYYYMKMNSDVKFILSGDDAQLKPIEEKGVNLKKVDYFNSLVMKELVDYNMDRLLINHRSGNKMWELFGRLEELEPCDFGNDYTRVHLCWSNQKRISINKKMMDIEVTRLKRKPLRIAKQEANPNSQDVKLIVSTRVMAFKTNKAIGIFNGDCFNVTSIEPLVIKNTSSKEKIKITTKVFQDHCYVNYATTIYKSQGSKIETAFSIHEWQKLSKEARYTAISRTTKYENVNVIIDSDDENEEELDDTNVTLLQRRTAEKRRMNNKLYRRRKESHAILMRIVNNPNTSDGYSIRHTLNTRQQLLEYLKIEDGIPKNYNIDHIRERKTCVSNEYFQSINYFTNLRLLPYKENIGRNFQ